MRAAGLLLLLALAACGDRGPEHHVAADSAGVRLVTSTDPQWGREQRWRVDTAPLIAIGAGTRTGDPLLVGISGMRLLSDGRLAVATSSDRMIRYFGGDARMVGSFDGSTGDSTFRRLALVGERRDSLLLWDADLDRVAVIGPDAVMKRRFRLQSDSTTRTRFGFEPGGWFDDGSMLAIGRVGSVGGGPSGLLRDTLPIRLASATGTLGALITTLRSSERLVATGADFVSVTERPFGRHSVVATDGTRIVVGTGDSDALDVYDMAGRHVAAWRLNRPRRSVPANEMTAATEAQAEHVRQLPPAYGAAMARVIRNAGVPTIYPPYDRLLIDARGDAWLREDAGVVLGATLPRTWAIIDRDGIWLGNVVTPGGLDVQQVTEDRVIGTWRDPMGVEVAQVYRLRR